MRKSLLGAAASAALAVAAAQLPLDVVYFAGLGGSDEGYREGIGKDPDVALNHNDDALAVHRVNFPHTETLTADVFDVDPRTIRPGVKWRSFWASPDCRHFSKAKGAAPVSPRVRGLAWVVVKVAKLLGPLKPDVIFLENVEEFQDWAPLIVKPGAIQKDGSPVLIPDPAKKGQTFRRWVRRLEQCGYEVEWRELVAADYGAPTTRKRLFVIARCDGQPIVWPAATHAPRQTAKAVGLKPWVPAAEIIDFSLPCPSIFLTQAQVKAQGLRCRRPLEEATLQRIAKGTYRYVVAAAEPFIVPLTHRDSSDRSRSTRDPAPTITGAHRGELALVAPVLTECANGSRRRANSVEDPLGTVTAWPKGGSFAQASIFLTKFSENSTGHLPDEPLHTVMAGAPRHGLVAAFMEQANTGMVGHDMRRPTSTMVGRGTTQRLVTAHLDYAYGSNSAAGGGDPRDALHAVTAQGNHHYVLQHDLARPFADHGDELRAFLIKYYGPAVGQDLVDPLHSVTSRARFGLVLVQGEVWRIRDIGMRMLTPAELKAAQSFPKHYVTGWDAYGRKVSKTTETLLIGNSVPPKVAAAIVAANLPKAEPQRVAA